MANAQIVGWSHTLFGKSEAESTEALIAQALAPALEHAGIGGRRCRRYFRRRLQ